MAQKQINTILSLRDKVSGPLFKISKNVGKTTKEMRKALYTGNKMARNFTRGLDKLIKKGLKWATVSAGLGATFVIKSGFEGLTELEDMAAKVESIARGKLNFGDIKTEGMKLSTAKGIPIKELLDAQYMAISTGIDPADSLMAAYEASKLAKVGFTDVRNALTLVATTTNALGLEGEKAFKDVMDKFLMLNHFGVFEIEDMIKFVGKLTPVANTAGLGINEMNTALATLTHLGAPASESTTGLLNVLDSIIKPTKKAAEAYSKYGVDVSLAALKQKGLIGIMEDVYKKSKGGRADILSELFPSKRAFRAASILMTKEGIDAYKRIFGEMKNSAGETDKAYEKLTNSIGFKFKRAKNAFDNMWTDIVGLESEEIGGILDKLHEFFTSVDYDKLIKTVDDALKKLKETLKGIFDFLLKHKDTITSVGGKFFAFYYLVKGLTKAGKFIGETGNFIQHLTGGISVFGGLFQRRDPKKSMLPVLFSKEDAKRQQTIFKGMTKSADKVNTSFSKIPKALVLNNPDLWLVAGILFSIGTSIKYVYDNWDDLKDEMPNVRELIELVRGIDFEKLKSNIKGVAGVIKEFGRTVKETLQDQVPKILDRFTGMLLGSFKVIKGLLKIFRMDSPKSMLQGFKDVFQGIGQVIENSPLGVGIRWLKDLLEKTKETFDDFRESVVNFREKLSNFKMQLGDFMKGDGDAESFTHSFFDMFGGIGAIRESFTEFFINIFTSLWERLVEEVPLFTFVDKLKDTLIEGFDIDFGVMRESFNETKDGIIEDLKEMFLPEIDSATDSMTERFSIALGNIKEKFKDIFTKIGIFINKIIGQVNKFHLDIPFIGLNWKPDIPLINIPEMEGKAMGTNNWKGGLVQVNERGGEIMDLPKGTRIYPHDKSVRMAREESKGTVVNVYGNIYGIEDLVDKVGGEVATDVVAALANI